MNPKKDTREALTQETYDIIKATGQDMSNYRVKGVKSNMLYTDYLEKDYSQEPEKEAIKKAVKKVIDLNNGSNCIAFTKRDGKPALIRLNGANVK